MRLPGTLFLFLLSFTALVVCATAFAAVIPYQFHTLRLTDASRQLLLGRKTTLSIPEPDSPSTLQFPIVSDNIIGRNTVDTLHTKTFVSPAIVLQTSILTSSLVLTKESSGTIYFLAATSSLADFPDMVVTLPMPMSGLTYRFIVRIPSDVNISIVVPTEVVITGTAIGNQGGVVGFLNLTEGNTGILLQATGQTAGDTFVFTSGTDQWYLIEGQWAVNGAVVPIS